MTQQAKPAPRFIDGVRMDDQRRAWFTVEVVEGDVYAEYHSFEMHGDPSVAATNRYAAAYRAGFDQGLRAGSDDPPERPAVLGRHQELAPVFNTAWAYARTLRGQA